MSVAKYLGCLAASLLFAASVHAADLTPSIPKDPLPDTLTWNGITLFGVVDLDYVYQTHGTPYSGSYYGGLAYSVYGNKNLIGPISSLSNNAMQTSTIGLKIDEPLWYGWRAVGLFESGFNPLSGELANACKSIIQNNGKTPADQNTYGDAIRCGQIFNGAAYGGVANPTYGSITIGRQYNLVSSNILRTYDPFLGSQAFSLPTVGVGAGAGSPEAVIWNNAIKYFVDVGPFHGGAMYSTGGEDQPLHGPSYAFDLGGTWRGFTVDAVYLRQHGGTVAFAYAPGACGTVSTPSCGTLDGTAFDSTQVAFGAKYTFEFAERGFLPPSRLTFSGSYAHIAVGNPDNPIAVGTTTIGGYAFGAISNNTYGTEKILQTLFGAASYELANGWSLTGAFYHVTQASYVTHLGPRTVGLCVGTATPNCAGITETLSGVLDYAVDKHLDLYWGLSQSRVGGGLASGYVSDHTAIALTGARVKF